MRDAAEQPNPNPVAKHAANENPTAAKDEKKSDETVDKMEVDPPARQTESPRQPPNSQLAKTAEIGKSSEIAKSAEINKSSSDIAKSAELGKSSELRASTNDLPSYSDPDPTLVERAHLWHEAEKGPVGIGGLGNVASVRESLVAYFPDAATTLSVDEPASQAIPDSTLLPLIQNFKFEDVESLFRRDIKVEAQILGVDPRDLEADADGKKRPRKSSYSVRTEDEDLLVMEERELTLDDITTTLIIIGIDRKRGSKSIETALFGFFRENYKILPQALGRFNRREEFWKVIFETKSDTDRISNTKSKLKVGDYEFDIEFKRPIMYRIASGDSTVDVPQAKKDDVITRIQSLASLEASLDRKRKEPPKDEQEAPRKKQRLDTSGAQSNLASPSPEPKQNSETKTIDLTAAKEEPKKPASDRDSGRLNLPTDIPLVPYNKSGYFPEDEATLSSIKVILRARRVAQDCSLWFLCGPLTAKITHDSVTDVAWVEAATIFERFPLLASKFISNAMDWSRGEILYETVSD